MPGPIVVLNAGSSSLKFALFEGTVESLRLLFRGQIEGLSTQPRFVAKDADGAVIAEHGWLDRKTLDHEEAIEFLFQWAPSSPAAGHTVKGVGHRVVHGGRHYARPVVVDEEVMGTLARLEPLAPLHQPHNLAAIRAIKRRRPDLPQVACFDTAFHTTQAEVAQTFALPRRYREEGVRRYGFHGLSYEYISTVLPLHDEAASRGRTVVAHLGNGASLCALSNGRSVATTMGFSALEGLPMGTRCGTIDPGVLLYLLERHGLDANQLERVLYQESGLLGVSGVSSDMRALLSSDDPGAEQAVELFVYRIGRELGSLTAALGGLDAIVFTAGIGENAPQIRERVCRDAAWLGVELDSVANAGGGPCISSPSSRVSAWVIPTNEELMIARHTRLLLDPER